MSSTHDTAGNLAFLSCLTGGNAAETVPPNDPPTMLIGDLARKFDLTTRAIRFYEAEGLLTSKRFGKFRVYAPEDEMRMQLIVHCRRLGLPINLIKTVVDITNAPTADERIAGIASVCRRHLSELQARQAELAREIERSQETLRRLQEVRVATDGKRARLAS